MANNQTIATSVCFAIDGLPRVQRFLRSNRLSVNAGMYYIISKYVTYRSQIPVDKLRCRGVIRFQVCWHDFDTIDGGSALMGLDFVCVKF